jgi:hypothetical protein
MTQIEAFIFPSTQKSGIEPSPPNKPRGVARAYDADRIRNVIDAQDCRACIPPKSNRTDDIPYSRRLTVLKAQPDRTLLQQDQAISPHRTPIRSPRRERTAIVTPIVKQNPAEIDGVCQRSETPLGRLLRGMQSGLLAQWRMPS